MPLHPVTTHPVVSADVLTQDKERLGELQFQLRVLNIRRLARCAARRNGSRCEVRLEQVGFGPVRVAYVVHRAIA